MNNDQRLEVLNSEPNKQNVVEVKAAFVDRVASVLEVGFRVDAADHIVGSFLAYNEEHWSDIDFVEAVLDMPVWDFEKYPAVRRLGEALDFDFEQGRYR